VLDHRGQCSGGDRRIQFLAISPLLSLPNRVLDDVLAELAYLGLSTAKR
jgi:hypothetical protein